MNPASEINEQNARVEYIERLYHLNGRHHKTHPLHGLYTGLYQDRQKILMQQDRVRVKTTLWT